MGMIRRTAIWVHMFCLLHGFVVTYIGSNLHHLTVKCEPTASATAPPPPTPKRSKIFGVSSGPGSGAAANGFDVGAFSLQFVSLMWSWLSQRYFAHQTFCLKKRPFQRLWQNLNFSIAASSSARSFWAVRSSMFEPLAAEPNALQESMIMNRLLPSNENWIKEKKKLKYFEVVFSTFTAAATLTLRIRVKTNKANKKTFQSRPTACLESVLKRACNNYKRDQNYSSCIQGR